MADRLVLLLAGMVTFAALLALFGFSILALQRLKTRQMAHEERMAAIRQGVAPPPGAPAFEAPRELTVLGWLRLLSFAIGLLLLFSGGGIVVAFMIANDNGLNSVWPVGLIPCSAGVGLILFALLARLMDSTSVTATHSPVQPSAQPPMGESSAAAPSVDGPEES